MHSSNQARARLEVRFRNLAGWDVTPWAEAQGVSLSPEVAQEGMGRLWARFSADWETLTPNPGGTAGHHQVYLQAKLAYLLALAHPEASFEGVDALEDAALAALQGLWREWAGYYLTAGSGE